MRRKIYVCNLRKKLCLHYMKRKRSRTSNFDGSRTPATAHLSTQFKALTGLTPRQYKQQKNLPRIPLDKV